MVNSVPLAEIVEELENGSRPEGGVNENGDVFSIGGEHLNDFGGFDFSSVKLISHDFYKQMKRGKVKPGDIIIVKDGATTGKTSFVNEQFPRFPCAINEHVFRLAVNQTVAEPRYVFYYLYSPKGNKEILDDFRGATVGGISQDFVNKVFIPLPPLTEQKRIASLLARADRLRQLRRTARGLADSLLQSVFLEMFGDPIQNSQRFQVEELEGFTSLISSGSTPLGGSNVYKTSGIRFIRSQNVLMNKFDFSDVAFISEEIHNSMKRTVVKRNDVLLNITGASIGRVACYQDDIPANVNQHVCIIRCKPEKLNPIYLSHVISMPSFQEKILANQSGATRQALTFEQIREFTLPIPPLPLQEEFARVVVGAERRSAHTASIESLRRRMAEAERQAEGLFQSLLAESFGGG